MTHDRADVQAVLDVAAVLASDPPPTVVAVLGLLRSLIACDGASFNDMTLTSGDFRHVMEPADDEALAAALKPAYDRLALEHPLIVAARNRPSGSALRFCDVPGGDRLTESPLYLEFLQPFGVRYQLAMRLPSPPDVVIGPALNRSEERGEFDDRDVAVLNALAPHLAMHHRRLVDCERSSAMADEADRGTGWSVLTVRSDGVVEASSSQACAESFAPSGRVPPGVVDVLPRYGDVLRDSHSHDLTVDGCRWRCVVRPVPVGPTVLLVRRIGDESAEATPLIDLGLTPRQTEVAIALARTGGTNAQLGRSLGISEGTTKKHLETVFRALAVDSRAAAAVALRSLFGETSAGAARAPDTDGRVHGSVRR